MRILSKSKGFECEHSSVNYEFISDKKISDEAKEFAKESSYRFKIGRNKLEITIPGENYLYGHIQDALLEKYNIPLLIYEDYDWWNFLLMFDYDEKLMKNLENYDDIGCDHTIHVSKKGQKIELWITVHIDCGSFDDNPFEELGDTFLDIREDILNNNMESLQILKKYCEGKNLSDIKPSSELYKKLVSSLDEHWWCDLKFNDKELLALFKAVKIIQSGEELLGIDIDKAVVDTLAKKFLKVIDVKSAKKIDKEIASLINRAREANQFSDCTESDESEDYDGDFGPSYAYSDTLKILDQAIENGQVVEINYYSANQGNFTKRKVKPENIERKNGAPYLNAFCYLRNDDRVFKLSRIKDIKIVKEAKKWELFL